jgi:plasmid stabilization system protein ParE
MSELYEVRITGEAGSDLEAIHHYISLDSPQNADTVVDRLLNAIDSLERMPHRYKVHRRGSRRGRVVRSMPLPPFVVYYEVREDERMVRILTVRHGARRRPRSFD